jgi:hypothetical protein
LRGGALVGDGELPYALAGRPGMDHVGRPTIGKQARPRQQFIDRWRR